MHALLIGKIQSCFSHCLFNRMRKAPRLHASGDHDRASSGNGTRGERTTRATTIFRSSTLATNLDFREIDRPLIFYRTTPYGTSARQVRYCMIDKTTRISTRCFRSEKSYVNIFDAIRQGDVDSFHLAIRRGTSIDIRDRYNKTPLMVASALGQVEFIRTLLAKE